MRFLHFIQTGIRYGAQPVGQLLEQAARQFPALPLGRCCELLGEGLPLFSAWKRMLDEMRADAAYHTLAESFGAGLGATDVEGQLAHCELYLSRFGELLEEAREQYRRKGRLYVLLGGLTGLAVSLLLI